MVYASTDLTSLFHDIIDDVFGTEARQDGHGTGRFVRLMRTIGCNPLAWQT